MKPETAKALQEVGKAIAKSQGFEGEIIMTVNCREQEVPDYFFNIDEDEMENICFGDEIIGRLETIRHWILNNTYDCPAYIHEFLAITEVFLRKLLNEIDTEKIESSLQKQKRILDELIVTRMPEDEYQKIVKEIKKDKFHRNGFSSRSLDFQNLLILKEFYKKYNLPDLTLYELQGDLW